VTAVSHQPRSKRRSGPEPRSRKQPRPSCSAADARRFWRLSDRELDQLVAVAGQVDRVELKLTVPRRAEQATCAALGVQFRRTPDHQVFYFDTPDRLLRQHGVVFRARSRRNQRDDVVVKLRPAAPEDLPARLRRSKRFVVEIDGMPGTYVCSAASKTHLAAGEVARTVRRGRPPRRLLSPSQLRLLTTHLPAGVDLDRLATLGPVDVHRGRTRPAEAHLGLVAERWTFPDGTEILELSRRCPPAEVLSAAARTATVLLAHGLDLTGPHQLKTLAAYRLCRAPAV
jgi:hypothetical protein